MIRRRKRGPVRGGKKKSKRGRGRRKKRRGRGKEEQDAHEWQDNWEIRVILEDRGKEEVERIQ